MIEERQYIKDPLYDFFFEMLTDIGAADIPLIYDNENGTRPPAPFLMIGFRSTVTPGTPDYSGVDTEGGGEVQRMMQYTRRNMTMYGFGERSIDVLETIKSQLNVDKWVDKLRKQNLVIPQTMETIESPQAIETTRENGASFDFDLTYIRVIETQPGYVDDIELDSDFTLGESD